MWSTMFIEKWKQYQNEIAMEWGMSQFESQEPQRPEFKGAVVVVSHDQFFVNSVCDEAWVVNNGKVKRAASFKAYVERQVRKLER